MNLCQILAGQARERGDAVAILEPRGTTDRTITFGGLEERTGRAARLLRDHGLGKGDRVLLLQPISIELYVALLAVLRIGGVVVLIDPSAGAAHFRAGLARVHPRAFIGSTRAHLLRLIRPPLRALRPAFTTGTGWPGIVAWRRLEGLEPSGVEPCAAGDAALITFTSGSTGLPKVAVRSHGFLLAQHAALERAIDLKAGEIDLATLPVFVLANLASGVTTLLPDADLRRPGEVDPGPILRQLAVHRPIRSEASPAFYDRLLGALPAGAAGEGAYRPLACFRKIFTGGAPVFPRLLGSLRWAAPDARIVAVYGSTEAEPIAHIDGEEISAADLERMYSGGGLLTGTPVPEIELRIVRLPSGGGELPRLTDEEFSNASLAANEAGEIVVHGEHVIPSYLDGIGDAETKFEVEGIRWHRTGDTGYLDDRGRLWLLGRTSATVEDGRGVLHPFSVECAASRFEWVKRSALVARGGERLLAVEADASPGPERSGEPRAPIPGTPTGAGRELDELGAALAWAQLDRILLVPRIPVDRRHNAKIDYIALEAMLARH